MKRICIVTCGALPVPAINGGAIEQLMEILIDENEKNPQFEFTVVEGRNEEIERRAKEYKHTQFVFFDNPFSRSRLAKIFYGKVRGLIRRTTGQDIPEIYPYNRRVINYLCQHGSEFDYIISEGCERLVFKKASKMHGRNKFLFHLHMNAFADQTYEQIFGGMISVGEFIKQGFNRTKTRQDMPVEVLPNKIILSRFTKAIEPDVRASIRSKYGFSDDDLVLIYCARIVPQKGVRELMNAVVATGNKKIKLMVVGSSDFKGATPTPYQREVVSLSKKHSDQIVFTGYVDNDKVYQYHKSADVGVMPSIYEEPFCLAILEMMASGLPTIATISGGMPEEGTPETTIFVKKEPEVIVDNLKAAILKLYENPELRRSMSERAIERSKVFDSRKYLSEFAEVIEKFDKALA